MEISRYFQLKSNGKLKNFPRVTIKNRSTDVFMTYNSKLTRLDRIASNMYGDDTLYWLILLANPQYYVEFDIPTNSVIRIPYPLNDVMAEFQSKQLNNIIT